MTGIANGLFELSADGVLTHLQSGYRVPVFPTKQSDRRWATILTAAYAKEFKVLNRAFDKSMTYDQHRALDEAAELNRKINDDQHFNRLLAATEVRQAGGSR